MRSKKLRIGDGEFGRVVGRHDIVLKEERRGGGGRLRQDEDRGRNARATKLDALVHRGDGQLARAGIAAPILILSEPPASAAPLLLQHDIMPSVYMVKICLFWNMMMKLSFWIVV